MSKNNDFIQIGIDYGGNEDKHCAVLNLYYNDTHHLIYETFDKEQIKALDNVLHNIFEQQVKAMAWDIVKEKRIDIESFYTSFIERDFNYDFYSSFYGSYGRAKLTKEEFNLLKEVLG